MIPPNFSIQTIPHKIETSFLEMTPSSVNPQKQSKMVQEWMERYKGDFVAHTVANKNLENVLEDGAVLPAEAVLKKRGSVEFQKGSSYESRGEFKLRIFSDSMRQIFEMLSPKEELEYKELKEKEKKLYQTKKKKL